MQNLARAIRAFAHSRDHLLDFVEREVAEIGTGRRQCIRGFAIFVHSPIILIET